MLAEYRRHEGRRALDDRMILRALGKQSLKIA
jgi:hypothetical protein